MNLHIYLDESYISELETRSRERGYFFLVPKLIIPIQRIPPENVPVHEEGIIMRNFMESVKEAELG